MRSIGVRAALAAIAVSGFGACSDDALEGPVEAVIDGPSQVEVGEPAVFSGELSRKPEGVRLSYAWTLTRRPATSRARIEGVALPTMSFTPDVGGGYRVALTVSTPRSTSDRAESSVEVVEVALRADAGPDQRVDSAGTIQLDGTGTFVPADVTATFGWTVLSRPPGGSGLLGTPNEPTTTLTVDEPGRYSVELAVEGGGERSTDTVEVAVEDTNPDNRPPIAEAGQSRFVNVGTRVELDGSGSSDPDGDPLNYAWSLESVPSGSGAAVEDAMTASARFTPDLAGAYRIRLTVDDGALDATAEVTVTAGGAPSAGSTFDPAKITVRGTLQPAVAYFDVFCDPENPEAVSGGAPESDPVVRPSDGAVLYVHEDRATGARTLRIYREDPVRFDPTAREWLPIQDAELNDPVVATPTCPDDVLRFLVHPGDSRVIYECGATNTWHDEAGRTVNVACANPGIEWAISWGYDGAFLCTGGVVDPGGTYRRIVGLNASRYARARPEGGFFVLGGGGTNTPWQRILVNDDATFEIDHEYGPNPTDLRASPSARPPFDANLNLYLVMRSTTGSSTQFIARFSGTSTGTVVYDGSTEPNCKLHTPAFATGP